MHSLDPFNVPLEGSRLIEAAAGTGKTWTIAALYLRLIIETDVSVPNVLVVTYTRAATGELKQRLRDALEGAITAFEQGTANDHPLFSPLLAASDNPKVALRKLQRALAHFDQAAVFTIHGFCERILSDYAFQTGGAFETELISDEQSVLSEVVDDIWRQTIYPSDRSWSSWLAGFKGLKSADDLCRMLRPLLGKPFLKICGDSEARASIPSDTALQNAFEQLREEWRSSHATVSDLLMSPDASLNRNRYRPSSVQGWLTRLDSLFAYTRPEFLEIKGLDYLEKLTTRFLSSSAAVRKGGEAPAHAFFDRMEVFLDAVEAYRQAASEHFVSWVAALRQQADSALVQRKRTLGLQSFDDLLLELDGALAQDTDQSLRDQLRAGFQAVLLDEFQDTDPIQYDIFRIVYGDGSLPVFMVGDPKQAIYSFRGADLFAYLKARGHARERHSLRANYRAHAGLVAAVNAVFSFIDRSASFVFDEIAFEDAVAASSAPTLSGDERDAALVLWHIQRADSSKYLPKGDTREAVGLAVAVEITELLNGDKKLGDQALRPQHIAVLVRSHVEGQVIQRALQRANIPCVRQGQQSVYQTHEASELERVLQAVASPRREALVRAALLTDLMGYDVDALQLLEAEPSRWDQILTRFFEWHELWRESGFMKMFRTMVVSEELFFRLNRFEDSDRRLTNLIHLSERIEVAAEQHREMATLLNWLASVRMQPPHGEEESLLRLDSDDDRVRIVTIHASKGLQYPVVFLPFAWDSGNQSEKDSSVFFHDPTDNNHASVDLGTSAFDTHKDRAALEQLAENVRLLYVGLTRAESRCYMAWGGITGASRSALAWLLHRETGDLSTDPLANLESHFATVSDEALRATLDDLSSRSSGEIAVCYLPRNPPPSQNRSTPARSALAARDAKRAINRSWQLSSFSALSTGHDSPLPDHDRAQVVLTEPNQNDFFGFPRGARAGTCLHRIFELIDFSPQARDAREVIVSEVLTEFGFEGRWAVVVMQMLDAVLGAPLGTEAIQLDVVERRHRVDEMAFCFPTEAFDRSQWTGVLARHMETSHPVLKMALQDDFFAAGRGFMQGFIDLVFEADGRFYLVDYKSNFLGRNFSDYAPPRLDEAMYRSQYSLQYLIYTMALSRWLANRVPGYDYDTHFGGVFYLFLRGINPHMPGSGVFFDRPQAALVNDLLELMGDANG